MKDKLPESAGSRAAAYWFIDGFQEMITGGAFFLFGTVAIWYEWYKPQHPDLWVKGALVAAVLIFFLLVLFAWDRRVLLFLKSWVTFPRTGYVRPPVMLEPGYEKPISLGLTSHQAPADQNVTIFDIASRSVLLFGWALAYGIARPIGIPVALTLVAILLYLLNRKGEHPYHWASLLLLPLAGLAAMPFSPPGGNAVWLYHNGHRRRMDDSAWRMGTQTLFTCASAASASSRFAAVNVRIREISEIDRVVHEPARLKILMFLQAVGEADFLYLQREGEFTQGNLSGHLRKLEDAGYVAIKKTFKGRMPLTVCSLTAQGEKALAEYRRQMWEIVQP